MGAIKFTETVFTESGKQGILVPDANGYFTVLVGALNSYNSMGEFYTAEQAIELFSKTAHLMRRIQNGALFSELGHPKRLPGQSVDSFYNRIITIEETNICSHIAEIELDMDYGRKNPKLGAPNMIALIAKVKPTGARGHVVADAFANAKQSAAYSIRGITDNKTIAGKVIRFLTNVITFDFVMEPGIAIATKMNAPSLESLVGRTSEIIDTVIDKDVLRRVLEVSMNSNFATESTRDIHSSIMDIIRPKLITADRLKDW